MDQEENITTLLSMGFENIDDIRKALRLGKNDINEAVSILTNEHAEFHLGSDENMKDVSSSHVSNVAPPPYEPLNNTQAVQTNLNKPDEAMESDEFPTTNLYELETRIFTDHWSIPFKKEESLGKCIISATQLAEEGLCEVHENCRRFIERVLPEAFKKLLTSGAVRNWGLDVQEGVRSMLHLFINLVTTRLKSDPVPETLCQVLEKAFDPEAEFHMKNRHKPCASSHWLDSVFAPDQAFAVSRNSIEPYGWLVDLINKFAQQGGFKEIQERFKSDDITTLGMAAMLAPLAKCAEFLNPTKICPHLSVCMDIAVHHIKSLTDNDIKSKNVCSISELLKSMKLLCLHLWPQQVIVTNKLCLEVILRMLKCPHFNARMNGLKEVMKLIDDTSSMRSSKIAIDSDNLLNWLSENKVLSIALEGNIDQVQYTEKIKGIVEFTGHRLSLEELTKIWMMQDGQNAQIVDNIHSIMLAASSKFNSEQFEHMLQLVQESWQNTTDQIRKRLIIFIGRVGKETNQGKSSTKIVDLLWELAHSLNLSMSLIELALEEQFSILRDVSHKDCIKKQYCVKCIEDIKKGVNVLPALRLLHNICKSILKSGVYKQDRASLHELNKNHDMLKLVTTSLAKCHKQAALAAANGDLKPSTIVDGRYSHEDYLIEHLSFMQFILQDGAQYLPWIRAKDIWEALISDPDACDRDREICLEWFTKCLQDLESETQTSLFQNKLLKLEPAQLTYTGFNCFKTYFESVNASEHRLKRTPSSLNVEKLELNGIDFLWQVALSSDEVIANVAIDYLLEISYHALVPRLKKDVLSLHNRFINECYKKLECVSMSLSGNAMIAAVSNATKTLTAISVLEAATSPAPKKSERFQNICRLLQTAERYISSIEENHPTPRTILSHGTSFVGHPLLLKICIESTKEEHLVITHSNETLGSVKQRIAQYLHHNPLQVHLYQDDISIPRNKEQRQMSQLGFQDGIVLTVKCESRNYSGYGSLTLMSDSLSAGNHSPFFSEHLDQEKVLPGVVMAAGGHVFDKLYQLSTFEDANITSQVRSLLHLIPTDPAILDALDSISVKKITEIPSPGTPKSSPKSSPKKFTVTSPTKERCESPKEVLKHLFDVSYQMSPFKLLYNLEVLSGKLMPVVQDTNTLQSAQMFSNHLLSAGGLSLVLNVLQKDSISSDIDYDIRQGCYLTALAIARFLLCGESGLEVTSLFGHPLSNILSGNGGKLSIIEFCTSTAITDEFSSAVTRLNGVKAIETIKPNDLLLTLSSLVRLSWAAAAGNLLLVNCALPSKENAHFSMGRRSRQSSTGSNASSGSDNGDGFTLQGGVCAQQQHVGEKDVRLALKALNFLVTCIKLRTDVFSKFAALPCISEFVIDVLLCSSSIAVRQCALEEFTKLSSLVINSSPNPRDFLIGILLKARLPLWVPSSCTRGDSQKLLSQCTEYFELGCRLLKGLTDFDQKGLHIDPRQMIEDEVTWLQGFSTSSLPALQSADSALLAGHFRLIKTLLTCDGVHKLEAGKILIPDLLMNFLFPASLMISAGSTCTNKNSSQDFAPKCKSLESCIAAFEVLVELATGCPENMEKIAKQLISMHHSMKPELAKEYEYEPLVAARATCGYVGLKNAGATCYMNSVIQQIYMQPGIKEAILSVDENEPDEDGLFYQFQMVFGHLLESRLQYHAPEKFWKCFRLWGQPINVREQQDAFEFFTHLIDQVDEYLIKNEWDPVFKPKYEGTFSDQKICQGCPHRYEREETFMALNLPIKSQNLIDSLDHFVKGELLEGPNAYLCEKCHEKRNTIKRTCIKNLPPVLVIQLKRFDYDWESNRSLKFDDYFKFPWKLDMQPYTAEGIHEKESSKSDNDSDDQVVPAFTGTPTKVGNSMYELVGVLVHSGQANAGHYYSYIKERRLDAGDKLSKWFKFNDITVEDVDMNDMTIEAECFGGTYKAKVRDSNSSYPETRQRYWNAYMLFYEKLDEVIKTPRTPRKTPNKFSFRKSEEFSNLSRTPKKQLPLQHNSPQRQRDSLSQLTQLVDRGERHGLFLEKMPARIQQVVQDENLRFMHNCDIYNDSYFLFIRKLLFANVDLVSAPNFPYYAVNSLMPLSLNFLLNTYLRYKKRTSDTMNDMVDFIEKVMTHCQESSFWFIEFFSSDAGLSYLKPFLLDCPCREVRQVFARILEKGITNFLRHDGEVTSPNLHSIIIHLLDMLSHDVPDNCKSCSQYFWLLSTYAQLGHKTCSHLIQNNAFQRLLTFLLGPASANMQSLETFPRRWTPLQTQEFGSLHITMAFLTLSCDLTPHRTTELEDFSERTSIWSASETFLSMPKEIADALYGPGSPRYLQEVVSACREVSGSISVFTDMLVQCSFCNEIFSISVIRQIMLQYSSVPSNELKNLSFLLLEILAIEDSLQLNRVQLVIDGMCTESLPFFDGMLAIIRANETSDSRRSYQGVKFLVSLSLKCSVAKDYLLQTPDKWQWAVNWLKKMMSEHSYWTPSNVSVSNEDSNTKTFQRTVSAQDTLAEATALLVGLESPDSKDIVMDVDEDDKEITVVDKVPSHFSAKELRRASRMQGLDSIDT
ncbi:ubiquitin carboxyl-terminal hydrolase 24 [Parasteatoda tepidariorum]|nr:ubiquitin carboxyl-terminal hydrolase 24 [Parasteatoda tepidariorum]